MPICLECTDCLEVGLKLIHEIILTKVGSPSIVIMIINRAQFAYV